MNPTRKKLTLPSGATCVIRALSLRERLSFQKGPPRPEGKPDGEQQGGEDVEFGFRIQEMILLQVCQSILLSDGREAEIIPATVKPLHRLESQIAVDEFDQADADAIVRGVFEMSGIQIGKEAAKAAPTFPEEKAVPGQPGQGSAEIQQAPHGTA